MKILALVLILASGGAAQVAERANEHYQTPKGRESLARGFSRDGRDAEQKPKELVESLGIRPGMTVADLGTGSGYMLPHFSRAVGPSGKVIAEDIFPDFLDRARAAAGKAGLENVAFVLGGEKDPNLPAGAVDVVFTLDAYHHFNYPQQMLEAIAASLKPGGRFVVVDFYKSAYHNPDHIRLEDTGAIREIEAQGFRLVSRRDHMPKRQYVLVFER